VTARAGAYAHTTVSSPGPAQGGSKARPAASGRAGAYVTVFSAAPAGSGRAAEAAGRIRADSTARAEA
jgi:hypothetical protein